MKSAQLKQHNRGARHYRMVLFVNVKQFKHNDRNGRDRPKLSVFDKRFRIQAKLPLRKHGLNRERQIIQARSPKRKRNIETIVFVLYKRF